MVCPGDVQVTLFLTIMHGARWSFEGDATAPFFCSHWWCVRVGGRLKIGDGCFWYWCDAAGDGVVLFSVVVIYDFNYDTFGDLFTYMLFIIWFIYCLFCVLLLHLFGIHLFIGRLFYFGALSLFIFSMAFVVPADGRFVLVRQEWMKYFQYLW